MGPWPRAPRAGPQAAPRLSSPLTAPAPPTPKPAHQGLGSSHPHPPGGAGAAWATPDALCDSERASGPRLPCPHAGGWPPTAGPPSLGSAAGGGCVLPGGPRPTGPGPDEVTSREPGLGEQRWRSHRVPLSLRLAPPAEPAAGHRGHVGCSGRVPTASGAGSLLCGGVRMARQHFPAQGTSAPSVYGAGRSGPEGWGGPSTPSLHGASCAHTGLVGGQGTSPGKWVTLGLWSNTTPVLAWLHTSAFSSVKWASPDPPLQGCCAVLGTAGTERAVLRGLTGVSSFLREGQCGTGWEDRKASGAQGGRESAVRCGQVPRGRRDWPRPPGARSPAPGD